MMASMLLVTVDWLHRRKLSLQVSDGGLCCLYGSSFAGSLTDTYNASAAIPHDAADICEVEADQPVDHQQIRDGANGKAGPLLSVALIASAGFPGLLTRVGAEMTKLHGSPHGGVLISLPWIDRLARGTP